VETGRDAPIFDILYHLLLPSLDSVALLLAVAVVLAGCDSNGGGDDSSATVSPAESAEVIAFSTVEETGSTLGGSTPPEENSPRQVGTGKPSFMPELTPTAPDCGHVHA
jgi:hypothetical protein